MNSNLQDKIHAYIYDTRNPVINFELAREYEIIRQYGSALTHYLKSAELSNDPLLEYEALVRIALCFKHQEGRLHSEINSLLHAIPLLPNRPEAYFHLADCYRRKEEYKESMFYLKMGRQATESAATITDLEFPEYGFDFVEVFTAHHRSEAKHTGERLKKLITTYYLSPTHRQEVLEYIKTVEMKWPETSYFNQSLKDQLRISFSGLERVNRNYSQCYQDLFVLMCLDGKQNGTYFEIGSSHPWHHSNTKLLEEFGWTGFGVDIDTTSVNLYNFYRENKAFAVDATTGDLPLMLSKVSSTGVVDYLQLDCDPAENTLKVLKKIPFDKYAFRVITFEHDNYNPENRGIQEQSRDYLLELGYKLVVANVSTDKNRSFEDWYVHPGYTDAKVVSELTHTADDVMYIDEYMYRYL